MKEKLFILTGPTAIGKTELSINLAKSLNSEIVSCDSMQIYKYMDIGTAKVTKEEMNMIKHHMVGHVDVDQEYTVSNFQEDAAKVISNLNSEGKLPLVTGGTGLYINSLTYKLNFAQVSSNEIVRNKYESILNDENLNGKEIIYNKLKEIDPISAERIHFNDTKRIIRAIEIFEVTGKSMSEYNKDFRKENDGYNLCMVALTMDRQKLYDRIDQRVNLMFENGLIEEVESILKMGYDKNLTSLQGIGYKEVIEYLEGNMTLEQCIELIQKGSRNYAKRQLTWFRRDNRFKWFDKDEYKSDEELHSSIYKYVNNKLEGGYNE